MTVNSKRPYGAKHKWALPLAAGFIAVILVSIVYRHIHPTYPKNILALSARMGLAPQEYLDAEQMRARAGSAKFTPEDWRFTKRLFSSDNKDRQVFSLIVMGSLYKTAYQAEASRCAQRSATSSEPIVKAGSIVALARLHSPVWHDLAVQNHDSPDLMVRQTSRSLLDRQDRFK